MLHKPITYGHKIIYSKHEASKVKSLPPQLLKFQSIPAIFCSSVLGPHALFFTTNYQEIIYLRTITKDSNKVNDQIKN